MLISIVFNFSDGPWGGGNQFLKSLRKSFIEKRVYTPDIKKSDVIIFNSHHNLYKVAQFTLFYPNKTFIHRVDGPIFLIRNQDREIDDLIFYINQKLADGTIFQSQWSKENCIKQGMGITNNFSIIPNAPNNLFFHPPETKKRFTRKVKIKVIMTSWSKNPAKGFNIYEYLDNNADFNKYSFTFVGNSPVQFKNIEIIDPVESKTLGNILRNHDLFLTASLNDPCSNSLIEALHCGLPALVRNSGGHEEIIGNGGLIFNDKDDVLEKLDILSQNLEDFKEKLSVPDIDSIAGRYIQFCHIVSDSKKNKKINYRRVMAYSVSILIKCFYHKFERFYHKKR